mgnify:CR=1 FL=1
MPQIALTRHQMDRGLVIMVTISGDISDDLRADLERLGYTDYREDGTIYRKGASTPAELAAIRDPLRKYFA